MAASRVCSIPKCGKPHKAHGWCQNHYQCWRNNGDPINGRGTPHGEPERYYREVVLSYEGTECLLWPYSTNGKGYATFKVDGKTRLVTRFVCEEKHGPPPSLIHHAAHSCGKGHEGCVTKRHLSWKTPAENEADKLIHGTHLKG